MSTIIKNENNEIILYCKGADQVLIERMKNTQDLSLINITSKHLE